MAYVHTSAPESVKQGSKNIYYTTITLYLITGGRTVNDPKYPPGSYTFNGIGFTYVNKDGGIFDIERRAGVTFETDVPEGYFDGQGGLLSYAEYDDIMSYLQKQPFHLVKDWREFVLSNPRRLPPCKIKWTETDDYMSH